jgi:hypothetical protein
MKIDLKHFNVVFVTGDMLDDKLGIYAFMRSWIDQRYAL